MKVFLVQRSIEDRDDNDDSKYGEHSDDNDDSEYGEHSDDNDDSQYGEHSDDNDDSKYSEDSDDNDSEDSLNQQAQQVSSLENKLGGSWCVAFVENTLFRSLGHLLTTCAFHAS